MCVFHEEHPNVKQTEIGGIVTHNFPPFRLKGGKLFRLDLWNRVADMIL